MKKKSPGSRFPTPCRPSRLPMSRANDDNPFRMPTDAEVFALRDEEQARKRAERELMLKQHVWEKGVKKKPPASDFKEELAEAARAAAAQQSKLNMVAAATRDRRKEKENMADFIAKKREMFLVQMSLDTKRAEIRKLEERAQQREEALKKSEQMLEEDALRFDQFLKDNDAKAVQAIKKAEAETKVCEAETSNWRGSIPAASADCVSSHLLTLCSTPLDRPRRRRCRRSRSSMHRLRRSNLRCPSVRSSWRTAASTKASWIS